MENKKILKGEKLICRATKLYVMIYMKQNNNRDEINFVCSNKLCT